MFKLNYLLPKGFKTLGIFLLSMGIGLAIVRFHFGLKPDWLSWKVFAFFSSYLEAKSMLLIRNNMSEELSGLFVLAGLFFMVFSRENIENEAIMALRLRAFRISFFVEFIFLICSFLLTFGFAFVYMMMANMLVPWLAYIIAFRIIYTNHIRSFKKNAPKHDVQPT